MSSLFHDPYWIDTANFIQSHIKDGERLIAPSWFGMKFPGKIYPYSSVFIGDDFQWVVIHKGMLEKINYGLLKDVVEKLKPVFANEVFVLFSTHKELPEVDRASSHIKSFWQKMRSQRIRKLFRMESIKWQIFRLILRHKEEIKRIPISSGDIDPHSMDYSSLSVSKIRNLMDDRFAKKEAYNIIYLWDKVRADEINKITIELISPTKDKRILEIGCGIGGSAPLISECMEFIGTDLSEVAISQANQAFGNKPNFRFIPMDAMDLKFDDKQFDIMIAREVIEHLPEPQRAIKEAFRVLRPNGLFFVTSPNRDSLHLRVNRRLGYADFKCSFDHVKEYTYREAVDMLSKEGFVIKDTRGVFLLPYWGIPDIDIHVRHLTDDDPQMVELLRELGERVGAEYAFGFVILCVKPGPGR